MKKNTLKDIKDLENKIILVRVDFNVPIEDKKITSDLRIIKSLKTIDYLIKNKAKVVLFSHLGRIKNEEEKEFKSLSIVAEKLRKLTNYEVQFINKTRGLELETTIKNMKQSTIVLVENTRFEDFVEGKLLKNESNNNIELGKYWASLGDVFVNDAFGTSHRSHASNVGIASNIKESAIGFLVEEELEKLSVLNKPERPYIAIMGGAKISDKLDLIETMLKKADKVIIGSALCYTFYPALNMTTGNSFMDKDKIEFAKKLLKKYENKIVITKDSLCVEKIKEDVKPEVHTSIPNNMIGASIGPASVKEIKETLKGAKTVIWNGPLGVTEFKNLRKPSEKVAKIIAKLKNANTIIGGGDSAAMVNRMSIKNKFTHISTGGGSTLEFLKDKPLPGIEIIKNK